MTCDVPGFEPPKNKGIYTKKQYLLIIRMICSYLISSKLPSWLAKMVPKGRHIVVFLSKDATYLEEKAWFSEEYRFATITNGYLSKEKFSIVLESCFKNNDRVLIHVYS